MREDPARQLDSGRHQERRPVHGVEPDDVLADHVQIGGPEPPEQLRVGVGEADAGQVVGQRVDPHVHHVVGMVGHRHAPVERGARDRQVAQSAGDEADHLVAPHVGPDELRVRLVVGQQLVGVGRQPEEVGLLLGPRHRRAGLGRDPDAVGATRGLGLGEEASRRAPSTSPRTSRGRCRRRRSSASRSRWTPRRWSASVVRMKRSKEMSSFSCSRWNTSELRRASSAVGMPSRRGRLGHLQPVLVGAGQEAHVEPVEPLEPRDRVGGDVFVGVPDVRGAVGIGDRCRDVVRLAHFAHHLMVWR